MKILNRIIEYGLYLFVILLPWQTRWIYREALNGGVIEYERMSLYGSEIVLLVVLFLAGVRALINRSENREPRTKNWKLIIDHWSLIILFIIWSALSLIWSSDKLLAAQGFLRLLEGAGLIWLISRISTVGSPMFYRRLTDTLIFSGLIQAIFGISQFFNQGLIQANKWLGLSEIDPWNAGTSVIEFLDQRWLRAYGSLSHPNILGGFLVVCLLLIIINLWKLNLRISTQNIVVKKDLYLNVFYWLSGGLIFFGLIVSFSRSAWLGFLVGFIFMIVSALIKKEKLKSKVFLKIGIMFTALGLMFLLLFPYQLILTRIESQSRLEQQSINERQVYFEQFQEIIKSNLLTGVGLHNYVPALRELKPNLKAYNYQPVHNVYLLVLAELGVVGLLLFLVFISYALRTAMDYRLLIIVLLVIGFFDHYLWSFYFGLMLLWLIFALIYAGKKKTAPSEERAV